MINFKFLMKIFRSKLFTHVLLSIIQGSLDYIESNKVLIYCAI